jgi:copper chaperone CopZ
MKHIYAVTGMHCQSCVPKIQSALESIPEVTQAKVTFDPPQAEVKMSAHVDLKRLNDAVQAKDSKYRLEEKGVESAQELPPKSLKTYWPLILVVAYILLVVGVRLFQNGAWNLDLAMTTFMGAFFLGFSFFKFLDLPGFAMSYRSYDIVTKRLPAYGYIYPFIELALGVSYLLSWQPFYTNVITVVVMSVSLVGVLQSVLQKRKIQCACLGAGFNLPMSTITVIEDALMIAMAAWMLV